jgi:hypothetical protein
LPALLQQRFGRHSISSGERVIAESNQHVGNPLRVIQSLEDGEAPQVDLPSAVEVAGDHLGVPEYPQGKGHQPIRPPFCSI